MHPRLHDHGVEPGRCAAAAPAGWGRTSPPAAWGCPARHHRRASAIGLVRRDVFPSMSWLDDRSLGCVRDVKVRRRVLQRSVIPPSERRNSRPAERPERRSNPSQVWSPLHPALHPLGRDVTIRADSAERQNAVTWTYPVLADPSGGLDGFAKVGVAGSNPVVRSQSAGRGPLRRSSSVSRTDRYIRITSLGTSAGRVRYHEARWRAACTRGRPDYRYFGLCRPRPDDHLAKDPAARQIVERGGCK